MSREEFGSLRDVIEDVARRKREAALARRSGGVQGAETPRDVFLGACQSISEAFAKDGFNFHRSSRQLIRTVGQFDHSIAFQSSHNNIAGRHVVLWMYANVRCPELGRWRNLQPHPIRTGNRVAGGMVHLLEEKHAMVEWELADANRRPDTVDDAIAFIRSVILPYLSFFENPSDLVAKLEREAVNAFHIADQIELALCFAGSNAAQRILDRFISERTDLSDSIRRAYDRLARDGFPDYAPSGYADVVAWARLAYGLKASRGLGA